CGSGIKEEENMSHQLKPWIKGNVIFGLVQLVVVALFALPAFNPSFRGGGFLIVLIAITLVAQILSVLKDLFSKGTPASEEPTQQEVDDFVEYTFSEPQEMQIDVNHSLAG